MTQSFTPSGKDSTASRGALAGLALSTLMASLGTSIPNVALPTLAREFGATFQDVQWVVLAYLLAITTLIVSVGKLGDLTGRRRLLLGGIAVFTLASGLVGAAPTLGFVIAARLLQGAGAAVMMVLALSLATEAVPKERTGRAMGIMGTTSAIGTALGPTLGGVLLTWPGWRAIFFVQIPLGLFAFSLIQRHLAPEPTRKSMPRAHFDAVGTLVLGCVLLAYALAMTMGRGHFGAMNLGLLAAALLGVGVFVAVEVNATSPLVQLSMFRSSRLSANLGMTLLVSTVLMTTLVVGPFYLAQGLGMDAAHVGLVMSVGPVVSALTGIPAGRLVDRLGAERITSLGLCGVLLGCALLIVVPIEWASVGYIAPLAVMTSGYALFQAANNTAVMKEAQPETRGVTSGLLNLARYLGLITGASVMGAIFAASSGARDITEAHPDAAVTGLRTTFAVASLLAVLGLGIALRARTPSTARSDERSLAHD